MRGPPRASSAIVASEPASAAAHERSLLVALANRDVGAQERVWTEHLPMVRRVLTRGLGPGSDVEDLVQEVFLLFFKNVARVRQEGSIRSYILAVTVNALRGELRARTARRWLHLRPAAELPEQAFEAIDEDARELVRRFYRVLDGLSANERALFVLRFVELRSLPEVAAALGVSLATVKRKIPGVARKVHARAARDPLLATRLEGMPRWSYEGQS